MEYFKKNKSFIFALGLSSVAHVGVIIGSGFLNQAPQLFIPNTHNSIEIQYVAPYENANESSLDGLEVRESTFIEVELIEKDVSSISLSKLDIPVSDKNKLPKQSIQEHPNLYPQIAQIESFGVKNYSALPLKISNKAPHYPKVARKNGWEGVVELQVSISNSGSVADTQILKSSGYQVLDSAAVEAVKNWKFEPAKVGNVSVQSTVKIPIDFTLKD